MKPDPAVNRRMHGLLLWGRKETDPTEVVTTLAAMQAQEFGPAKWSVAQRSVGANEEEIERLFSEGRILRTHVLRPTWHFVSARDIGWMLELSAPRVHTVNGTMYRREGIDEQVTTQCARLLREALRGGEHLTRTELRAWLARNGVEATGPRLAYILMWAELEALVCSGPRRGKQHTYALLEERAPDAETRTPEDALAELTRRYFSTRGPATVKDFTKWSGLTVAQARSGLEMVEGEFEQEEVEGLVFHRSPDAAPEAPGGPVIDLVQGYDEVVSSYGESRPMILGEVALPGTRPDPPLLHTILSAGMVVGHWKESVRRDEVTLDTHFYRPLSPEERRAFEEATRRLGAYFGLPVRPS